MGFPLLPQHLGPVEITTMPFQQLLLLPFLLEAAAGAGLAALHQRRYLVARVVPDVAVVVRHHPRLLQHESAGEEEVEEAVDQLYW